MATIQQTVQVAVPAYSRLPCFFSIPFGVIVSAFLIARQPG